jgi:hypothetical protein
MDEPKKPKEESSKAKAACDLYVGMGVDRSMAKVAMQMGHPPGYVRMLETWSSQFGWVERAKQYDKEQIEKRSKLREKELDKLYDELAQLCIDQRSKTVKDIDKLRTSKRGLGSIASVQLLKLLIDTHLHVLGDNDKQKIEITGKDEGPLDIEVTTFWGRGTDPRRKASDTPAISEEAVEDEEDQGEDQEYGIEVPDD